MRPVKFLKILPFFILTILAGLSFSASANTYSYRLGSGSIGLPSCSQQHSYAACYPSGYYPSPSAVFSSLSALCAVLPDTAVDTETGSPVDYSYICDYTYSLRAYGVGVNSFSITRIADYEGDFADDCDITPNSPYCETIPDPDPDPEPEPEPFAPDSPYCIERPYDPICTGDQEPTQNECAFGVGADSCCASLAAQRCGTMSNVLSWELNASLDTCTYSCDDGQLPPPEPPEPPEFDNTPPDIVDPTAPSTPEAPSDPENPLSGDIARTTQSINDLNRLIAESSNITNNTIANADRNNQAGLQGVIDAVNAAGANNYIGQGTPLADNFGDGTLSSGDKAAIRDGLGITSADEGWGSIETTVNIEDYSSDYNYVISSSGCPAPYQMQLFGSSFELSYQPFCDIFEFIGYLVMLAGVFLTPYIVFGFRGK